MRLLLIIILIFLISCGSHPRGLVRLPSRTEGGSSAMVRVCGAVDATKDVAEQVALSVGVCGGYVVI